MGSTSFAISPGRQRWVPIGVAAVATLLAVASALPYAGSWNDGSRLAPIESLVDHHTWIIDRSIFIDVPRPATPFEPTPYPRGAAQLMETGALDKLCIAGHFYSDKPPVLALFLAGVYQAWQWLGGPTARMRPDLFCYLMTLASAGLSYVVAVYCTYRLGEALRLPMTTRLVLTASLALATFALCYTRHVNNHIVMLGVTMPLFLALTRSPVGQASDPDQFKRLLWIGTLAGLAYAIDVGPGPVLLLCLAPLIWYRYRRLPSVVVFGMATLPWLLTHHAINYAIGGSWKPLNTFTAYHEWPGCPFDASNLTGGWNHTPGRFLVYLGALLFGKHGFVGHNLPLFLALAGLPLLWRRRPREMPELIFGLAWCAGTWLMFGALSTNYAGQCCSIRWFAALLAPGYFVLAILLREFPEYRPDLIALSAWGAILGAIMWWYGPWIPHMVPLFWPIQGAALVSWVLWRRRQQQAKTTQVEAERLPLAA